MDVVGRRRKPAVYGQRRTSTARTGSIRCLAALMAVLITAHHASEAERGYPISPAKRSSKLGSASRLADLPGRMGEPRLHRNPVLVGAIKRTG
jgi:hypothetical protein